MKWEAESGEVTNAMAREGRSLALSMIRPAASFLALFFFLCTNILFLWEESNLQPVLLEEENMEPGKLDVLTFD